MDEQIHQSSEGAEPTEVIKNSPPRRSYKNIVIVAAILLASVGLLGYAVLWNRDNAQVADDSSETPKPTVGQPDRLIYSRGDGATTPIALYTRDIDSGDEVKALTLPERTYIENTAVSGNQVAISAHETGDAVNTAIYYSDDSGRNYKKIYTAPESTGVLGTQITSISFSTDGKALVAGVLLSLEARNENQVTEISLEGGYPSKVLFTSEYDGVFLKGYDRSLKEVVYLGSGCYNCESFYTDIYRYDFTVGVEDSLYHSRHLSFPHGVAINQDFTKVLVLNRETADGQPVAGVPYTLLTVDIATKAKEAIKTFDGNEPLRQAGYTYEGVPYVATNTKIEAIEDDTLSTLLELSVSNDAFVIPWVLFVSEHGIVVDVVTSIEGDDRSTAQFTILLDKAGNAQPTEVLQKGNLNGEIRIIGVALK